MNAIEQLSALLLLIDFLVGVTFGVVGGASFGSRRGVLIWPAANDPVSAGARVIYGVYVPQDDGHPRGLIPGGSRVAGGLHEEGSGVHGQEVER